MAWILAHHKLIGFLADLLTFLGGALLARDALFRLRELQRTRTNVEFRRRFPDLNLTDEELHEAVVATGLAFVGYLLLVLGFLCQLGLRALEP